MAIAQGATNIFKLSLLDGDVNFASGSYKIALYTGAASIGPETDFYTSSGEVVAAGYTAGGILLTITQVPTIGSQTGNAIAYTSFGNVTWTSALTARGALIYNASSQATVCVLDFGADKTSTTTFTVQMPANTSTSALIRIA